MIASLTGRVQHKHTQGLVLECAGVGYGVSTSLPALSQVGPEGSEVSLLVHTQVGQDVFRLFGFTDVVEKACFASLIAISGVGPRLALAVLSTFSPSELREVVGHDDLPALTRIPGVGKKTAERLCLELKHRFAREGVAVSPQHAVLRDLVAGLCDLGYGDAAAQKLAEVTLKKYQSAGGNPDDADLAQLVRQALRQGHD